MSPPRGGGLGPAPEPRPAGALATGGGLAEVQRSRFGAASALLAAFAACSAAMVAIAEPRAAAPLLIGLPLVIAGLLRVDIALLLLVAATPLEAGFLVAGNPQLSISKLAGALCFASFLLDVVARRRRIVFDRLHLVVVLILLLALISTAQAEEGRAALTTTFRYGSFAALFLVVSQFARDHKLLLRLSWTLTLSSAAASAWAIWYFASGEAFQATLPYGNPNDLAFVLATSLPITLWLIRRSARARLIALPAAGVIAAGAVLTFSRGALVGLAAAVVWLLLTERGALPIVALGAVVAGLAIFVFARENPQVLSTGLHEKQHVAAANVTTRLEGWRAALRYAAENPGLGIGPGNFEARYARDTVDQSAARRIGVVHNTYLDMAAELGVGGITLFLAYLWVTFARLRDACRRKIGPPGLAAAVRTSLVVACVGAVFLSEQYYAPFWLLGALATAIWAEGRDRSVEAPAA